MYIQVIKTKRSWDICSDKNAFEELLGIPHGVNRDKVVVTIDLHVASRNHKCLRKGAIWNLDLGRNKCEELLQV